MGLSNIFVCIMGMGTVFAGLVVLILICYLISFFAKDRKPKAVSAGAVSGNDKTENRGELAAAISAAVAEELGSDVSAIRILSIKKK